MNKGDYVSPQEIQHKSIVVWDRAFGGHATELTIVQYSSWAEVHMKGGGFSGEWQNIIHHCPIEVMRKIVAMHDALPPMPKTTDPAI